MKILIPILLTLFIFSSASAGELDLELIDRYELTPSLNTTYGNISTLCIDGYKFFTLVHQACHKNFDGCVATRSLEQFFIEKDDRSVPAKC